MAVLAHLATRGSGGSSWCARRAWVDRDAIGLRWLREGGVAVMTFGTLARLPADVREADVAVLVVDDESVSLQRRVLLAERYRLGLDDDPHARTMDRNVDESVPSSRIVASAGQKRRFLWPDSSFCPTSTAHVLCLRVIP